MESEDEKDDFDVFVNEVETTLELFENGYDISRLVENIEKQASLIGDQLLPSTSFNPKLIADAMKELLTEKERPVSSFEPLCTSTPHQNLRRRSQKIVLNEDDVTSEHHDVMRRLQGLQNPTVVVVPSSSAVGRTEFIYLSIFVLTVGLLLFYLYYDVIREPKCLPVY
ncbi:unnamed protein product [Caenorhabditis auriculariae]|uniref:Uncharacterized protein n=1 Tax=Caenorhabditis auriculariae TaxID=2777116 RepID=A0A8S1GTI3_9PELO|nr:unnamed protein product [Caenorhabditis auriculariae]